jgi:hypothetical protein
MENVLVGPVKENVKNDASGSVRAREGGSHKLSYVKERVEGGEMPKQPREQTYQVTPVELHFVGSLHATTARSVAGQKYQLAKEPTEKILAARAEAGEPIVPGDVLEAALAAETAEAPEEAASVFRRDEQGLPFIHSNFIKGHLRDAADALSRPIDFWGFKAFVTTTLWVTPYAIPILDLDGQRVAGEGVVVDKWPTHFDIYRMGRVSSFHVSERVDNPVLSFQVVQLRDSRWAPWMLEALFTQGGMMGMGGGRRLDGGRYTATLSETQSVDRATGGLLVIQSVVAR